MLFYTDKNVLVPNIKKILLFSKQYIYMYDRVQLDFVYVCTYAEKISQ